MPLRRNSAPALATVLAGLIWACLGGGVAQAAFVPALGSPLPTGTAAHALAVGDADHNGTPDVVAGGLALRTNNGTGRLSAPIALGSPGAVLALASGDVTGDGRRDYVALAPGTPRELLQYTAVANDVYVEDEIPIDASAATDMTLANVNGDGLPDLIVTRDETDPNVTVLLNLGGAAFTSGISFAEGSYESNLGAPSDVEAGDLTGDGRPDLAVGGDSSSIAVLVNAGGGTFVDGVPAGTGASADASQLVLTHLDGDGRLDVAATDSGGTSSVVLLRGNGSGGFAATSRVHTGLPAPPVSIDAADVDGDNAADVVAGSAGGRFATLLGNGAGGATPAPGSPHATDDPSAGVVDDLVATDMNRDGQVDVVTANGPGSVSVLLNSDTGLLQPTPGTIEFGSMLPFTPARTRTLTLRSNRGRVRITRIDIQGSRLFSASGCLGLTLTLGQTCTMTVTFTPPRRARRYEALLSVDANAAAIVVPLGAKPRAPIVRRLRVRPRRVSHGQRLTVRYRLSEQALVRALFQRALAGRRVAGECVAPERGNLVRRRCTRWQTFGRTSRRGKAGPNVQRLRVSDKGKRLAPGRYRLGVSALDRYRNRSVERFATFVVRPTSR